MTALTVAQAVSDEVGLPTITSIEGSTASNIVQVLRHINNECNALARLYDWSRLVTEHTFTTVADTAAYALPSDFLRMLPLTQWNRTDNWQVVGPTSSQEWQFRKSGLVTTSVRDRFRITGNGSERFLIDPTPSSAETVAFEYVSGNWAVDDDGSTRKSSVSKNGDTFLFDEYLVQLGATYRFLKSKGFAYAEELAEHDRLLAKLRGDDAGGPKVLHMDQPTRHLPSAQIPDTIPVS